MLTRILASLAVLALAACQEMPQSKEKGPGPAAASPGGAADASTVARVQNAAMMSTARLRGPAGAGSTAPARTGAYPAAIVKDLAIFASDRKNLTEAERAEFEAIKPELSQLFGASFREALQNARYADSIVGDGTPGAVVIEATLTQLTAAANRGTMGGIHPGLMDFTVTVSDAAGNRLGSYEVHYEVALRLGRVPAMEVQRRVFPDAGVKIAQAIAKAR